MIYGALGRESLPSDKAAGELNKVIASARQSMDGFSWPKMKEEFPDEIRQPVPLKTKGDGMVSADAYIGKNRNIGWDVSPVPPIVRRTDPKMLEPQDVEANGGSGLLAFVDPVVRRQKILEEQRNAAALAKKQQKDQEKQNAESERGGRAARGGRNADPFGANVLDPEHPKRRPVVGLVRPAGVPLQDYEEVRVAHWAVVVAKVPIKEQLKLYRDAFENARGFDYTADVPQILGYFVERAEIRGGDDSKELKWEPVYVYNGKGERIGRQPAVTTTALFGSQNTNTNADTQNPTGVTAKWVSQMPEIVDPRCLDGGVLTFPLPPLVGRDWGSEVTHSDIPLAVDAVPEEETKQPEETKKPESDEPGDMFAGGAGGAGGAMGGRGGPMMGGERGYSPMGGRGGMEGGGRGGYGGGYGGGGLRGGYGGGGEEGGYGGRGGYAGGGGGGLSASGEPQAPYWLLRFFDFSVEPGKKYKYQVRMALLDPNQSYGMRRVDKDSLASDVITRVRDEKRSSKATPFRLTEWSKPSRTVTIPLAGSVAVAGAKPASDQPNSEPKATLLVQSFSTDEKRNAIEAAKEKDLLRGGVANMTEDTEVLADQGRAIDPFKDFKFQTDITVADIRGGERLTRDVSRPARVLLMGPAGQLFVQDEVSDAEVVETHRATFAKEAPGGGGFEGGGYRGGPGGYGGRGG